MTQAQLACLLTVSRVCRMLDAIDFFNSSVSGWFSLYVINEERSVEGTTSLPVYFVRIPFTYCVHFGPPYGPPLLFCGNGTFDNALVPPIHVYTYTYVVPMHACMHPVFVLPILPRECVLAMGTYYKQIVVALFSAQYVTI